MGREREQRRGSRTSRTTRRLGALLATAAATALLAACGSSGKGPVTLNWYVFPEPSGSFQAAATECSNNSHGAYNIKINFLSTSSDQQRVSLVRRLAASDSSIDILAMDVDWTAEFATAKWLKPVPASLAAQINPPIYPGLFRRPHGRTNSGQSRSTRTPSCCGTARTWCRIRPLPGHR